MEIGGAQDRAGPAGGPGGMPTDRVAGSGDPARAWPGWARAVVSALLAFHLAALLAFESAGLPWASTLERELAAKFHWYIGLIDQEYTHRYFAPEPDEEVPVLIARLSYDDGRPDLELRLPDPAASPRIRLLRQIALVWHLTRDDFREAPDRAPVLATSYARHLCRTHPGACSVTLAIRKHEMLPLDRAREAVARGEPLDLDSEDRYSLEEPIGEFSCADE